MCHYVQKTEELSTPEKSLKELEKEKKKKQQQLKEQRQKDKLLSTRR